MEPRYDDELAVQRTHMLRRDARVSIESRQISIDQFNSNGSKEMVFYRRKFAVKRFS